jgi:carnitine monooxygenase subunit
MTTKPLHLDVNEQIECAYTLASRFYTDPAILEIEKDKIFRCTWQLVGTLDHACGEVKGVKKTISDPETYFTTDVAGEPLLVVRDKPAVVGNFVLQTIERAPAVRKS